MGIEKTRTSAIESHHVFALLTGEVGAGKTYALGTLNEKDTLILSMEAGLLTLSNKDFEVWNLKTIDDLKETYNELKKGVPFKNIAIDSLTELSEILFASLKPLYTKAQNFGLYEDYSGKMITIIKMFRDLTQYNIFFTCLTKESDNGLTLDVSQKSLGTRLPQYFDFVGHIKRFEKDEKTHRAIVFESSEMSFCKTRSNRVEQFEKVNLTELLNKVLNKGE